MKQTTTIEARLSQPQVKEVYDGLSRIYDLWGALTERRARRRGLAWLPCRIAKLFWMSR